MRKIISISLLTIGLVNAADAHCYAHWYYPWPQNCGVAYRGHSRRMALLQFDSNTPVHSITFNIPLPDMSGIWINSTETEEQLELMEGLDRIKAIKSLSNNN